jgi:5-methylcytosine-specific restriction endonuclease McrA
MKIMKTEKLDMVQVCKQFEDLLATRLRLTPIERAVYWHLLRHGLLEGRARLRFSLVWLAGHLHVSDVTARWAVRRLIEKKVLRLFERSTLGHVVRVRLPGEVRTECAPKSAASCAAKLPAGIRLDEVDFLRTRELRLAIHAREGGKCFYCLRQTPKRSHCLDHVVPQAKSGLNSYRNLVSCCLDCNSRKGANSAGDHLRRLLREGRLTPREFKGRLRALKALTAGKLRPPAYSQGSKEARGQGGRQNRLLSGPETHFGVEDRNTL